MIRQYRAQTQRGGDNPLGVGIIAVGSIYYLQNEDYFRDRRYGVRPTFITPWIVEGFLNGMMGASRRNRDTGMWESTYLSGRSDMALVRSLRDRRRVEQVAVRLLILHDDLGLYGEMPHYPTLPDVRRYRPALYAKAAPKRRSRIKLAA